MMEGDPQRKAIPSQFVLYDNDAVDVAYSDGTRLQLSSCGSAFAHHTPAGANAHPIYGATTIKQRTPFVTSTYQDVVTEAVDFRNRFAFRPFLCSKLIHYSDLMRLRADIFEVGWPVKDDDVSVNNAISEQEDGSLCITSVDKYATVSLAPHRQTFTARFLCRVASEGSKGQMLSVNSAMYHHHPHDTTGNTTNNHEISSISCASHNGHLRMTDSLNDLSLTSPRHLNQSKSSNISQQHPLFKTDQSTLSRIQMDQSALNGSQTHPSMMPSGATTVNNKAHWEYKWLSQHYPIQDCPDVWKHPLDLLLKFRRDVIYQRYGFQPGKADTTTNKKGEGKQKRKGKKERGLHLVEEKRNQKKNCVYFPLPRSLPLKCSNSYLHKWQAELQEADDTIKETGSHQSDESSAFFVQGRIKVICINGFIYRFLWSSPRTLEVYPGDGSLLKSSGIAGKFFQHFLYVDGKLEERMYSVGALPPKVPGLSYSIAQLIQRAVRFFKLMENSGDLPPSVSCHATQESSTRENVDPTTPPTATAGLNSSFTSSAMLEECIVPELGKFTARVNGRVRVVFPDRTALDMIADFSSRLNHCSKHIEDGGGGDMSFSMMHLYRPTDIPAGACRLMLPNGHFVTVYMEESQQYRRYIDVALEWVAWVNTMPEGRKAFYKDTIYDPERIWEVQAELNKIQRFNFIMENSGLLRVPSSSQHHPPAETTNDPSNQHRSSSRAMNPQDYKHSYEPRYGSGVENGAHVGGGGDFGGGDLGAGGDNGFDLRMIQDSLRKSSQAVQDLDDFLAAHRKSKPS